MTDLVCYMKMQMRSCGHSGKTKGSNDLPLLNMLPGSEPNTSGAKMFVKCQLVIAHINGNIVAGSPSQNISLSSQRTNLDNPPFAGAGMFL